MCIDVVKNLAGETQRVRYELEAATHFPVHHMAKVEEVSCKAQLREADSVNVFELHKHLGGEKTE